MIDWRIAKIASSGIRGMRLRLRQPMSRLSRRRRGDAARGRRGAVRLVDGGHAALPSSLARGSRSSSTAPRRARSARGTRRRASGGAGRCRRSRSRRRRGRGRPGRAPSRRRSAWTVSSRVCSSSVDLAAAAGARGCRVRARRGRRVVDDDLDPLAADLGLELVGGAAGDDLAVVDDRDRVGQLVGLLEVLGREQQRRALARRGRG